VAGGIAPDDTSHEPVELEVTKDRLGRLLRLVRDDIEGGSTGCDLGHKLRDAWKERRHGDSDLGVVPAISGDNFLALPGREIGQRRSEHPLERRPDVAPPVDRRVGHTAGRERMLQRCEDAARRIRKRAVEVKEDGLCIGLPRAHARVIS